jgi:hypothetical protein
VVGSLSPTVKSGVTCHPCNPFIIGVKGSDFDSELIDIPITGRTRDNNPLISNPLGKVGILTG